MVDCALTTALMPVNGARDSQVHIHARRNDVCRLRALVDGHPRLMHMLNTHANIYGKNALHEAAQNHAVDVLCYLLEDCRMNVDCLKQQDWTPLMLACATRRPCACEDLPSTSDTHIVHCTVDILLMRGADVHLRNKDGWTAFHIATRADHARHMRLLLDVDANVWRTCSNNGRTPLHTASLDCCTNALQVLLQQCAFNGNEQDACGSTPFMDAVRAGNVHAARALYDAHMVDLSVVDKMDMNALHLAASCGQNEAIVYLCSELQMDVESTTHAQLTPVHFAVRAGHIGTLQLLHSRYGCRLDRVCVSTQRNCAHLAAMHNHVECARYILREHSGLLTQRDCDHKLPMDYARSDVMRQLMENKS